MFLVEGPEALKIETDENGIFETEGTQSLPIEAIAKRVHRPTQGLMFSRPEPANIPIQQTRTRVVSSSAFWARQLKLKPPVN
jgi:hypothetical protein